MDSDVSWPPDESGEISLVLDISSDSEVLLLLFEEVGRDGRFSSSSSRASNNSLSFGKLLNLNTGGQTTLAKRMVYHFYIFLNNIY